MTPNPQEPRDAVKALDSSEAANRQMDRMMASLSRVRPNQRPGAELGDPMTVIEVGGWFASFGPADIQAVLDEFEIGAPCGICHHDPCTWRVSRLS